MLTKVRIPRVPAPWLRGIYLAVGILAGCVIGPFLYRLLLHELTFESITAVSTVALAVATVYLGIETRRLAAESVRTEFQSERQHQQTMTPLLKLTALPSFVRSSDETVAIIRLDAYLENKGSGPAFDVEYDFETPAGEVIVSGSLEPLGVLERTGIALRDVVATGSPFLTGDDWRLRIRYNNLFGATAMTVYRGIKPSSPYFLRPPIVITTSEGTKTIPVIEKA